MSAAQQHVILFPMLSFNCCNGWLDQLPHHKEVLGLHQLFQQNRNHKPTISFLSDVFNGIWPQIDLRSHNRVTDPSKRVPTQYVVVLSTFGMCSEISVSRSGASLVSSSSQYLWLNIKVEVVDEFIEEISEFL